MLRAPLRAVIIHVFDLAACLCYFLATIVAPPGQHFCITQLSHRHVNIGGRKWSNAISCLQGYQEHSGLLDRVSAFLSFCPSLGKVLCPSLGIFNPEVARVDFQGDFS